MWQNVSKLVIGSSISQFISFLGIAFLARLYTPAQFGELALIIAFSSVGGTILAWRLDLAILLPRIDRIAKAGFATCVIIAFINALCFWLLLSLLSFLLPLGYQQIALSSLLALLLSLIESGKNMMNREGRYTALSLLPVTRTSIFIVFGYYLTGTVYGLVLATLASLSITALYVYFCTYSSLSDGFKSIGFTFIKYWIKKYRSFPLYSVPAAALSVFSSHMPVLLLTLFFGSSAAGMYSMLQRIVQTPISILSENINRVITRDLASKIAARESTFSNHLKVMKICISIGLCITGAVVVAWYLNLFSLYLGAQWENIDLLMLYMTPYLFAYFVSCSISRFAIYGRNDIGLYYNVIIVLLILCTLYGCHLAQFSLSITIAVLSNVLAVIHFSQIYIIIIITKQYELSLK